jgi:hypothetical protein
MTVDISPEDLGVRIVAAVLAEVEVPQSAAVPASADRVVEYAGRVAPSEEWGRWCRR